MPEKPLVHIVRMGTPFETQIRWAATGEKCLASRLELVIDADSGAQACKLYFDPYVLDTGRGPAVPQLMLHPSWIAHDTLVLPADTLTLPGDGTAPNVTPLKQKQLNAFHRAWNHAQNAGYYRKL